MATDIRRRHGVRGAILVETAIVVSALLTLMVASIELGIVGFLQLTVDAGSFLNAHQNVVGVQDTLGPNDATSKVFPQIKPSDYAGTAVAPAPTPSIYVDYGYNGTPSEVANSYNNRHGGASMMQPYLMQSSISKHPFSIAGIPINVSGTASEPFYQETAPEWDVANVPYTGSGSILNNTQYRANPFTLGENTPPYFMAQAFMVNCNQTPPWQKCSNYQFLAIGMGNNLNAFNWNNPATGVSGPANSTGSGGTTGTFQIAAYHQRMYANIAQFFAANGNNLDTIEATYNPYYWNNKYNVQQFTNWSGFTYMRSGGSWVTAGTGAQNAYTAIRNIYSWDLARGSAGPAGTPPDTTNYLLNPGNGDT